MIGFIDGLRIKTKSQNQRLVDVDEVLKPVNHLGLLNSNTSSL